ncbi:MAG: hypothetical protein G3M70_12305 [Candidatus Nitronauta litoralis]|uniref:O-antigen ligase-related domain-containing protein n=1 Tax=Candidatus Nitronauta litoralis TaxID=2705533 RepID=A0A7T0G188_9BACT|nr:MAG: hypothetical protein G3M70_12305 [Candidatus Nitronauta litoralis]
MRLSYILAGVFCVALSCSTIIFGVKSLILMAGSIAAYLIFRYPAFGLALTIVAVLNFQNPGRIGGLGQSTFFLSIAKIVGALTAASWAFGILTRRKGFVLNKQIGLALGFIAISAFSILFASDTNVAMADVSKLSTNFLLFFLIANIVNKDNIHKYFYLLVFTGFVASLMAILQVYLPSMQVSGAKSVVEFGFQEAGIVNPEQLKSGTFVRPTGTLGHPNWLSFFLVTSLPLAFFVFLNSRSWVRLITLVVMGMEIVAMVLTHDRMALVGFVWVLLLCVVTKVIRITPVRTVALMLSGVVFILIAPPTYLERVFSPSHYKESSSITTRWELLTGGLAMFSNNWLIGVGGGNFGIEFMKHNQDSEAARMVFLLRKQTRTTYSDYSMGAHNMYVEVATETGVIGITIFLAFLLHGVKNMNRIRKGPKRDKYGTMATMVMISILGFGCLGLLLHAQLQKIIWIVLGLSVAVHRMAENEIEEEKPKPAPADNFEPPPLPLREAPLRF